MKNIILKAAALFMAVCTLTMSLAGCGSAKDDHAATTAANTTQAYTPQTAAANTTAAQAVDTTDSGAYDVYPYDIAADKASFDFDKIDITVGDNLYMTQINDWFTNFGDYKDKSVVIEGYYMYFGNYIFVGRKGPSCPYCTGGYVNFEFATDEDLSSFVQLETWIRVTGILREGTMCEGTGQPEKPFYYIEAMKVEKLPQVGVDTISN